MYWTKKNWCIPLFKKNCIRSIDDKVLDKVRLEGLYLSHTMTTLRKTDHVHVCKIITSKNEEVCIKFVAFGKTNYGNLSLDLINKINKQRSCIRTRRIALLSNNYMPYTHLIETEYASLGSLYSFLGTSPKKRLVYTLFLEIIKELGSLHHKGILHNDIKPSNILVDKKNGRYSIRFNDFNIIGHEKNERVCTPEYTSPEIIKDNIQSAQSDIWALGVVLYELFMKKLPYGSRMEKLSPAVIFENILRKGPSDISAILPPFDKIVLHCLIKDVKLRPTSIKELLSRCDISLNSNAKTLIRVMESK